MEHIINYIRSCFCKHELELVRKEVYVDNGCCCETYKCKKCGYIIKEYDV